MNRRRFLIAGGATLAAAAVAVPPQAVSRVGGDVLPPTHTPQPETWPDNGITLAWLGHATVLINFYGVRIITDPVLFSRVGVDLRFGILGPLRLTAPALSVEQLPDIDLVLVSHAHFDHLDTKTLRSLPGRPLLITAAKTADIIPRRRLSAVHELGWDQPMRVNTARGDLEIRGLEVRHWGARLRNDTYRGYNGYAIRREGRALLFGGDTAHTKKFHDHYRHGRYDAAIMPIGAYPYWHNHCTPEESVAMADAAGARLFVPIHHKTFRLSPEPFTEPIERAEAALAQEDGRLAARDVGDTVTIA